MTPEQARNRLARVNVNQHERDALRTIANMRTEYAAQVRGGLGWLYLNLQGEKTPIHTYAAWCITREEAEELVRPGQDYRIITRYATKPLGDQP